MRSLYRTRAVWIASLLLASGGALAQTLCNGYAELCNKRYDQVVSIGAHNSFAVSTTTSNLAANQAFNVTTQLNNGIRLLQGQGHLNSGTINLCHTNCILYNGGPLSDYLTSVKTWLDANPNEVITLLWVNSDNVEVSTWDSIYKQVGMNKYIFTPDDVPIKYGQWPTLQEMIANDTRVVTFLDQGADFSSVPYLMDEFSHVWETPFDSTDATFPCTVDRPANKSTGRMYLMNHYLDTNTTVLDNTEPVPDIASLNTTNSQSNIVDTAQQCISEHNQSPTFILVDYYDRGSGSVFEAAASLNNVTYAPRLIGNASLPNGGQSSSSNTHSSAISQNHTHGLWFAVALTSFISSYTW